MLNVIYDKRFLAILIVIIIVIIVLVLLYTTGTAKKPRVTPTPLPTPPPACDLPGPVSSIQATIIMGPGGGTVVSWSPSLRATQYCVYQGCGAVTTDNYESKIVTSQTSIWFDGCQVGKYYFVCPVNSCGTGPCSSVTFSGL